MRLKLAFDHDFAIFDTSSVWINRDLSEVEWQSLTLEFSIRLLLGQPRFFCNLVRDVERLASSVLSSELGIRDIACLINLVD